MNFRIRFAFALVTLGAASPAAAGFYSGISGVTPGAIDNPIARSRFTTFENSVVSYDPAPGVGLNFRSPTTGLASLGELYSPVLNPNGTNVPFDKRYQPEAGTEPNPSHDGSRFSPFGGDVTSTSDSYGFIGIDRPGSITLGFSAAIYDGAGADFAVFENGFGFGGANSLFAELAFVEVSSNGRDFSRFSAVSLNTAPTAVSGAFQGYDMTNVYNLAGKHASNWGTPFDLAQLRGDALVTAGLLDLSSIRYVRLVDVVGSGPLVDASGAQIPGIARDSLGNPILDNWLTYDSAGFDYVGLPTGAVGVVYSVAVPEPASWLLSASGVAAVGLLASRARARASARRGA